MVPLRVALSNFVALIIVTSILAAASISLMYVLSKQITLLKPSSGSVELYVKCTRILNTSYYICNMKSNVKLCSNFTIITDRGKVRRNACVGPSSTLVFVVSGTPIAVSVNHEIYPIER